MNTTASDVGSRGSLLAFVSVVVVASLTFRVDGALFPISLIAAIVVTAWCWQQNWELPPRVAVLTTMAVLMALSGFTNFVGAGRVTVLTGTLLVTALTIFDWEFSGKLVAAGLVAGVILIGFSGILDPAPNDVLEAHRVAAERVVAGVSPYRDLGVVESNPYNVGALIDGYSYPPIALGVFGLASKPIGGGDTITIALWAAIVVLAVRRYGGTSIAAPGLALLPGLPISARYGWTEPLTVLLVLGALHADRSRRAILVGFAVASKQYVVLAVPAVITSWWRHRRWWLMAAGVAVIATTPVLFDLSGAYASLVDFHLYRPVRPDSSNLAGFLAGRTGLTTWPIPSSMVIVAASLLGSIVARRHGREGWLNGMVAALIFTLAFGPVALLNYWNLVAALVLLVLGERERIVHRPRWWLEGRASPHRDSGEAQLTPS